MNNTKIIKDLQDQRDAVREDKMLVEMEVALSNGLQILAAVRELKESHSFFSLRQLVLEPAVTIVKKRIESNLKNLVNDASLKDKILQDQGMLIAFQKFADLDSLEVLYKKQTDDLSQKLGRKNKR